MRLFPLALRRRRRGCDSNRWTRIATASSAATSGAALIARFKIRTGTATANSPATRSVIGARRDANYEEADHLPNRYERYVSWTAAGFTNLDHNRDRRISANEWHFDLETFRRVDRNRDGSLSQSEFIGGDIDDARDASFDDLDWNNNGRVERSEWNGSDSVFTSLDRNRDGVLSRFEVVGGVNTPNDTYDEFASLDYNRNGAISRDEWHWSAVSFDRRDTNRDGRLSRQEFAVSGGAPRRQSARRVVQSNSARCASTLNSVGPTRASSCVPEIR